MNHSRAAACFLLLACTAASALAQTNPCRTAQLVSTLGSTPVAQAPIVYDPNQGVCWLANLDLAGDPAMRTALGVTGVFPNGSMDHPTAQKWVAAMNGYHNGAGYLGHNDWQLPVAPLIDAACGNIGPGGASFGPLCTGSGLSNLYSVGLKLTFPASAVPGFAATVAPIHNLKSSYYWATQNDNGPSGSSSGEQEVFSFSAGILGGVTTQDNYFYVLPMIPGALGTPPACPASGPAVVPYTSGPAAGNAVYDCNTKYSWAADGNIAASNVYGIAGNATIPATMGRTITVPKINNGAMLFDTATQWMAALNTSKYLGSSAWQMPASGAVLKDLFGDLGLAPGDTRFMATSANGPFQNLQPFYYWGCQRDPAGGFGSPCTGYAPQDLQWTLNFDSGFQPTSALVQHFFVMVCYPAAAATEPLISLVANAEGEGTTIAPNTWVEIKGSRLAPAGDSRVWQASDFIGGKMPTQLDGVSVTVNGHSAYVYYISPTQINILTPPDTLPDDAPLVVSSNGMVSSSFAVLPDTISPSFFVFSDGVHVAAIHLDGTLVGAASLSVPGYTFSPAKPGEIISVYANGFGPTSSPVVAGAMTQGGTVSPLPAITIAGRNAIVQFAGLISPGLFQFNVAVPDAAPAGDQVIKATYGGTNTQQGTVLTIHP
ncbi:MAG TPA: hypothetical protein VGN17_08915 [Bryobacteraceae bacterium]|jgi:uncharacterized protein (TIGR03437 family)